MSDLYPTPEYRYAFTVREKAANTIKIVVTETDRLRAEIKALKACGMDNVNYDARLTLIKVTES